MIPQILYVAFLGILLGQYLIKHGEYRDGKYNFWEAVLNVTIQAALLYWGGFWNVFIK